MISSSFKYTERERNDAIKGTQKVIRCYYSLGKKLKDRLDHFKKLGNKERTAQALVNEEIKKQLFDRDIEQTLFIAKKIYEFFNEIGEDKMQIKTYSAKEISKLNCDDIDYILVGLANWRKEKNQDQERKNQKKDQEIENQEEKGQGIVIEIGNNKVCPKICAT
ncbi:hypothetical protein GLOIN_2v1768737 [Rhizophagus clarus]|nr:hypothetical protein GLOIN_2v1768737 [Rhizophagus clarus]